MVNMDDAYFDRLEDTLRTCAPEAFSAVVNEHKANMLADNAAEDFARNLSSIAGQIIIQENGKSYKTPADITDADLRKLEILRTEQGFDYMKDLRLNFTTFDKPFLTYLASKPGDFTDYQTAVIKALVERLEAESQAADLKSSYSMRSSGSGNHNERKNLFHVLLEGELTPNKKAIADLVAQELGNSSYRIYVTTASWTGPQFGGKVEQPWDTYRNALHSAVASGRVENVEYALSKGARQSKLYNGFGSTAFADAIKRDYEPAYHAMALRLFEDAMKREDGAEILREPSRWDGSYGGSVDHPIQTLARLGDLDLTVALAWANAGMPEIAVTSYTTGPYQIKLADYYAANGVYHPPVYMTAQARTVYQAYETGGQKDPSRYIHQAVFNLDPKTSSYGAGQDVFGKAIKYLVEKGALDQSDIPADSLTDERSLSFIFSLRAAAEAEKRRNPDFLAKNAVFTEGFADEVKKARAATRNFQSVYAPR
jgi:hypothetical protein